MLRQICERIVRVVLVCACLAAPDLALADNSFAGIDAVLRAPDAQHFYAWRREQHGFEPSWNFDMVLLGPDGAVVATWGSATNPMSRRVTHQVERLLQ